MNKLHTSVALAALAAIFMAAPAVAADVAPPPPEAYNWTGFHIGVGGGGNFVFVNEDPSAFVSGYPYYISGEHSGDLGKADFFGTVEGGFDYQLGSSFVLGVLANYDFGKATLKNKSNADLYLGSGFDGNGSFETKYEVGDSWAIGGRLGFLAMDNALLYVTGGYTSADIKAESSIGPDNWSSFSFHSSESGWEDGWFVGGGVEALVTDNISVKAEYRYNDYGSVKNNNYNLVDNEPIYDEGNDQKADVTVHSIRAVLSYRFGLF